MGHRQVGRSKKAKKTRDVINERSLIQRILILQGFTKFNFKLNLKVSAFYLEKQKSFSPQKKNLGRCQYQNKKAMFTDSIFQKVMMAPMSTQPLLSAAVDSLSHQFPAVRQCIFLDGPVQGIMNTIMSYFIRFNFQRLTCQKCGARFL